MNLIRQDLQIYRGLAIIFVIGYHLQLPYFKNGFLGVDIFFVLSGYLIAKLIFKYKLLDFYKKRIQRLLPSYLITILFTSIVTLIVTLPFDSINSINRIPYHLTAISNISYWIDSSYFDSSIFKPLLNLWSISVEFQFYFLAPFILFFLKKNKIIFQISLFVLFFIIFIFINASPKTSFYLIFSRLFEFIIGSYFAIYPIKVKSEKLKKKIIYTLFFFLIIELFFYPINIYTKNFILGHLGLAAVIISSLFAILLSLSENLIIFKENVITRFLILIGNFSFSLYLIHFPTLILLNYSPLQGNIYTFQSIEKIGLFLIITFTLTYLNYRYIEILRFKELNLKFIFIISICIFLVFKLSPIYHKFKYSDDQMHIFNAIDDRSFYRCGKIHRIIYPLSDICIVGKVSNQNKVLLLGDSHADSIKQEFTDTFNSNYFSTFFYVKNDPFTNDANDNYLINEIISKKINNVVIHLNSKYYVHETYVNSLKVFLNNLDVHEIKYFLIAPVPTYKNDLLLKLYLNTNNGNVFNYQSIKTYFQLNSSFFNLINNGLIPRDDVFFPHLFLCGDFCNVLNDGKPIYFDGGHLTLSGSKLLSPMFSKIANRIKLN